MLDSISNILRRCSSGSSVLPPTELYNEGWMLRLMLDWFDRNRQFVHPLSFMEGARWYSEALLPSRFLAESRADLMAESFTHADGVIGHFNIKPGVRGDATLLSGAKQFIVAEAKLGSSLAAGTKNARMYDQAARNVACMAHVLASAGVEARTVDRLAFYVLAPEAQIKAGVFAGLVTRESIERKVRERVHAYGGRHDAWLNEAFLPTLSVVELDVLSWESVIAALPKSDETEALGKFYEQCLKFNPLRTQRAA